MTAREEHPHCTSCGQPAPSTETPYTLIGSQHAWRVSTVTTPAGKKETQWRCPDCWSQRGTDDGERPRCQDCQALAPPTETPYTLISSSQHGWRVSVAPEPSGRKRTEWRCPECWERRKGRS